MKRIGYLLLAACLAGSGCLPESFLQGDSKTVKVELPPPPPPVVTADSITEQNARDRARALREELEHDLGRARPQQSAAKE